MTRTMKTLKNEISIYQLIQYM